MATATDQPAFTTPRCPAHQRAAVSTCVRCGTFLCGECTELLGEASYCASCVAVVRKLGAASLALRLALGLELIALASIPLVMLLPLRVMIRVGESAFVLSLLQRVPVLNGLAAGFGFWSASRERRYLARAGLPPTMLTRWIRGLAWVHLGFVVLQAVLLIKGLLSLYARMRP